MAISFLNDLNISEYQDKYEFHVIQSPNINEQVQNDGFLSNFIFYALDVKSIKSKKYRKHIMYDLENKIQPDCIFTTFGPSYHKSNFPKIVGFAIPYIIYNDSPFFDTISTIKKVKYYLLSKIKTYCFLKNSDVLIFETKDALKKFNGKINREKESYVVSNTLNEIFLRKDEWKEINLTEEGSNLILFLTANYEHKNIQILQKLIYKLIEEYNFSNFKFLLTLDRKDVDFDNKVLNYIEFLGKVPLQKIPSLYQKSSIVFIPTLLEVFSATYLEAMYMDRPIIASDMSFARDICNDAALYCEPVNENSYAIKIIELLNNKELYNSLIEKGRKNLLRFGSSKDRTNSYLEIIDKIIKENGEN